MSMEAPPRWGRSWTMELLQCERSVKGIFLVLVSVCVRVVLRLSETESYSLIHTSSKHLGTIKLRQLL